jgi:serine/threonine protein phosphatase PrpC
MSFWQRLFRRKTKEHLTPDRIKTAPLDPDSLIQPTNGEGPRHILVSTSQSTGMERSHNEDSLFAMLGSFSGEEAMPDFGMFIVADGMGGHRSGEVASSISVRRVAGKLAREGLFQVFDIGNNSDPASMQDLIKSAFEDANQQVVEQVPGGGTTLTLAILLGQQLIFGHVGDSRAYLIANGKAKVVTRDHSLVERLRELGQLTPEEAAVHPQRNVLYRAIGQGANLEVDVLTQPAPRDGYLLLCSDGLWGVLKDERILQIINSARTPQMACDGLIEAANDAGGPDNITAILVYFPPT